MAMCVISATFPGFLWDEPGFLVRESAAVRRRLLLQSVAERFRRLPGLLVADVGVAHGGADILVAEELLDLPQILPHVLEKDCGRTVA
jgi:hypothetical protein